jgi:hypothetical protein
MTAIVVLIASSLVILTVAIHLFLLRGLSQIVTRMRSMPVLGMGVAMVTAILAHVFEICVFAIALWWMSTDERFGRWIGDTQSGIYDYFYYSALTYTSLGFGDVAPTGSLRAFAAVEAITGLVLIAWTASFASFWQCNDYGASTMETRRTL